jgi:hypothetical protein
VSHFMKSVMGPNRIFSVNVLSCTSDVLTYVPLLFHAPGVPLRKTFTTASYVGESLGFDGVLNSSNFQVSSGLFLSSSGQVKGIGGWIKPSLFLLVALLLFSSVWFHLVESLLGYSTMLNFLYDAAPAENKQNILEKVLISTFRQSNSRLFILFLWNVIAIQKTVDWCGNLQCTSFNLLCLDNQSGIDAKIIALERYLSLLWYDI